MNQPRYKEISEVDLNDLRARRVDDPFASLDAAAFETLLRTGLEGYLWEEGGPSAFGLAAPWVARPGSLAEGLAAFYSNLKADQRSAFRMATANLIASLPAEDRYVEVFRQLLLLAPMLSAHEILAVLPARLGVGYFGQHRQLFEGAFLAVARLAMHRRETLDCLHTLITSPHFDSSYAGIALLALCKGDDSSLVEHLGCLRNKLGLMFAHVTDPNLPRIWAGQLLEVMPSLDRLAQALPRLKYFDRDNPSAPTDTWLIDGLFNGESPHLYCLTDADGYPMIRRRESSDDFPLFGDAEEGAALLSYLRDHSYLDRIIPKRTKAIVQKNSGARDYEISLASNWLASAESSIPSGLLNNLVVANFVATRQGQMEGA